jgi:hypothetical protein
MKERKQYYLGLVQKHEKRYACFVVFCDLDSTGGCIFLMILGAKKGSPEESRQSTGFGSPRFLREK